MRPPLLYRWFVNPLRAYLERDSRLLVEQWKDALKPEPRKVVHINLYVVRDARESDKVKARSGWRCEVVTPWGRCRRRAFHVHHMLGGIGVRGRGESAKAIRKQHVCSDCHSDIGNHVLVRQGDQVPHWTDRYTRVQ